mgnify:CR=1 FL=1
MGEPLKFDYYYGVEAEQFSFYRVPRLLIKDERFKGLSSDAKLLYGLMLDRMSLSMKNGWLDDENRAYIIYTVDNMMEDLGCAKATCAKVIKELDSDNGIGLIEKKRRGLGKPDIIYVKNFAKTALLLRHSNSQTSMARPFLPPPLLLTLPFLQKLDNDALYVITGIVLRKISANLIALNCYLSLFWLFFLQYHPDHCQRQLAAFSIFFQLCRLRIGNRCTRFLKNDCYILLLYPELSDRGRAAAMRS